MSKLYEAQLGANITALRRLAIHTGNESYYRQIAELETELNNLQNTANLEKDNEDMINKFYSNY